MSTDLLDPPDDGGRVFDEPLERALSSRYLAYALSTITSRALPDVRDGLKPVQRRILYAMRELKLDPASGFKKCAKIVGEVMGNYHPHGDQAIYDALVRLAQDFSQRVPLVDGQGNFGNVDGDAAAAMRYTEARLTAAAEALLAGIAEDAVDFRETYDGSESEPVVLPSAYPNLLANGSTGIAVGMATSIPPHNPVELIKASRALIDKPKMTTADILKIVRGPDFPTGGEVAETAEAIENAYETGRGAFRLRARWRVEDLGRGMWQAVVTEIPYQVQKSKLIERLAELIETRKAPLLADVRDESAEDVRVVLEPKSRSVEPAMLMESLYRQSELETRASLNLNVLDASGTPRVMGMKEALQAFLDHRRDVLVRRSRARHAKIVDRLELLAGYLIAYLNLDKVIKIIREEDEPKPILMRKFDLSDRQAEAILNMRLRALRKLEEIEIKKEDKALKAEKREIEKLLKSEKDQWSTVSGELETTGEMFSKNPEIGRRRTGFIDAPAASEAVSVEALVAREPITVVLSRMGWIRALRGRVDPGADIKYKDGDGPAFVFPAETTDKLILFATDGRFFTMGCDKLPGGRGHGEPIRLHLDLPDDHEINAAFVRKPGRKLLIASRAGKGFIVAEDDVEAMKRSGKQVLNLETGEEAAVCLEVEGDQVAVVGENKKLLIFPLADLPEMTRGKGVKLQSYAKGGLEDVTTFSADEGMCWHDAGGRRITMADWREFEGKRAQAGKPVPKGFPRSGRFRPQTS